MVYGVQNYYAYFGLIHRLVYIRQETTTFRRLNLSPKRCVYLSYIHQTMDRVQNRANSSVHPRAYLSISILISFFFFIKCIGHWCVFDLKKIRPPI
jgi:hypothetical protein